MLQNKNAVIYGGGGSIGAGVATTLAREGARVFLAGRTMAKLEAVAKLVAGAGGVADVAVLDALDEVAVEEHAAAVVAEAGSLDISLNLVNRGDVQGIPLVDMATADFTRAIVTGITTNFITARAAARHMAAQGSGVILAVSSGSARGAAPMMGSTSPTDAAIDSLIRSLASEVGKHGVRVLGLWIAGVPETLNPETIAATNADLRVDEDGLRDLLVSMDQMRILPASPRLGQIADTVAYLASDRAGALTGQWVNATALPL